MRSFTAKASHIFLTKNDGIFQILMFDILTKHELTMSLVLNSWALNVKKNTVAASLSICNSNMTLTFFPLSV